MSKQKKIRGKNFSAEERDHLIQCVEPHLKIIECQETNEKSNTKKALAWEEITNNYNAVSAIKRDAKQLRNSYKAFKLTTKKKLAQFKVVLSII